MPGKSKEPSINGTGIGLSIVKDLVELHHGTIAAESTEGVGTTFSITIPVERALYAENEIDLEKVGESVLLTQEFDNIDSEAQSINKPGRYSLPKILLVEDNKELREYLTGFFERNFKVYSAVDGLVSPTPIISPFASIKSLVKIHRRSNEFG